MPRKLMKPQLLAQYIVTQSYSTRSILLQHSNNLKLKPFNFVRACFNLLHVLHISCAIENQVTISQQYGNDAPNQVCSTQLSIMGMMAQIRFALNSIMGMMIRIFVVKVFDDLSFLSWFFLLLVGLKQKPSIVGLSIHSRGIHLTFFLSPCQLHMLKMTVVNDMLLQFEKT